MGCQGGTLERKRCLSQQRCWQIKLWTICAENELRGIQVPTKVSRARIKT